MEPIGFIILSAPIWTGLIFAFYLGLQAFRYDPKDASTHASLRWIALNLCEPLVNFILIGLITYADLQRSNLDLYARDAGLHTLPMIVLLLSAKDLNAANPFQRKIATHALNIGIARWLTTIAIHVTASGNPGPDAIAPLFALITLGTFLLWGSIIWGRGYFKQIKDNESQIAQAAHA